MVRQKLFEVQMYQTKIVWSSNVSDKISFMFKCIRQKLFYVQMYQKIHENGANNKEASPPGALFSVNNKFCHKLSLYGCVWGFPNIPRQSAYLGEITSSNRLPYNWKYC